MRLRRLVDLAKLRWRIEHDYRDLKQEVGLGHCEGHGWPGFHHHSALSIAAYGFLMSERERIPPLRTTFRRSNRKSPVPSGYRPAATPLRRQRHVPNSIATIRRMLVVAMMPVLPPPHAASQEAEFMTQSY
jgi:Transposase DDE domain